MVVANKPVAVPSRCQIMSPVLATMCHYRGPYNDACWEANPLPLGTEGMTHACENITFPQLLFRTVIKAPCYSCIKLQEAELVSKGAGIPGVKTNILDSTLLDTSQQQTLYQLYYKKRIQRSPYAHTNVPQIPIKSNKICSLCI